MVTAVRGCSNKEERSPSVGDDSQSSYRVVSVAGNTLTSPALD